MTDRGMFVYPEQGVLRTQFIPLEKAASVLQERGVLEDALYYTWKLHRFVVDWTETLSLATAQHWSQEDLCEWCNSRLTFKMLHPWALKFYRQRHGRKLRDWRPVFNKRCHQLAAAIDTLENAKSADVIAVA